MVFSDEERRLLERYVSDPDENVFVVTGLPGIVGATFARYSRAQTGLRETLLREFIQGGQLDPRKADELIQRVLIAYGDDSVGELEGAHLALEQVSNLVTKEVEDRRIGGSPIEQSTRYLRYDARDEQGRFKFLREPRIMVSEFGPEYEAILTFVFERYSTLVQGLQEFFQRLKPMGEAEYAVKPGDTTKYKLAELIEDRDIRAFRQTYNMDLRTKACDTARVLLPAATLTNVGIFGNGRYFQNLLTHLYTLGVAEMDDVAVKIHGALSTVIPQYIRRAKKNEYVAENERRMQELTDRLLNGVQPEEESHVVLLNNSSSDGEFMDNMLATMLYKYSRHPMTQLRRFVAGLPSERKEEIMYTYVGNRASRRDRPGRALEFGYPLTFDITGDFGIYRDLERHRMLTQERQRLSTDLGFSMPDSIVEAGFKDQVEEAAEKASDLYHKLKKDFPYEAQYAVLFGFNMRWTMGMNPREAGHMLELRTGPQGHPNYRRVCQQMHDQIVARHPQLAAALEFVNHRDYFWSRGESEAAQRRREAKLGLNGSGE